MDPAAGEGCHTHLWGPEQGDRKGWTKEWGNGELLQSARLVAQQQFCSLPTLACGCTWCEKSAECFVPVRHTSAGSALQRTGADQYPSGLLDSGVVLEEARYPTLWWAQKHISIQYQARTRGTQHMIQSERDTDLECDGAAASTSSFPAKFNSWGGLVTLTLHTR